MKHLVVFTVPFLALTLTAGCAQDTGEPPAPTAAIAPAEPQAEPALEVPVVAKRTIEVRNPFGNTKVADNLMADGDFELTGRYDQQSWIALDNSGQAVLNFDTGGHCRSGVRCLSLGAGEQVVGWFTAPPDAAIEISLWAKPTKGKCKDLNVMVVDVAQVAEDQKGMMPPTIDDDGMCHFQGTTGKLPAGGQPALQVRVDAGSTASFVIDDVVAKVATTSQMRSFYRATPPAIFRAQAEWLRTHRRFGLPPTTGPERPAPTRRDVLRAR